MRVQFDKDKTSSRGGLNDAQQLLHQLEQDGAFKRYKLDDENRLTCLAWAHEEQRRNTEKYFPVVVSDTTFNTSKYNHKLAFIVVVDKENHTQIAMQALLDTERHESFVFLMESFKELIRGSSPKVIFTDTDQSEMSAIAQVFPGALNKLCYWHKEQNVKAHGKGLPGGILQGILRKFKAAAYAPTLEAFVEIKTELLSMLDPESGVYKYMLGEIFNPGRAGKWASFVHPGLHTLGIASTQRVEGTNCAVKKLVTRTGDLADLERALLGKVQDDAIRTQRRSEVGNTKRVSLSRNMSPAENVKQNLRGYFAFITAALTHERCSTHAKEDTGVMIDACLGYSTKIVASGETDVRRILQMFVDDPTKVNLMLDTNSGEFIDPAEPTAVAPAGVHLASRAPVSHFAGLLRDQAVDKLVRVALLQREEFCHLVALGPDGCFLCTCLRPLVYGLLCPHGLKAMFDTGANKFNGASIAPRWRESSTPWTLEPLAAKPAMLDPGAAECPVELPPFNVTTDDISHSGTNVKAAAYANGTNFGKDMGVLLRQITTLEGIDRVLESTKIFFKQQLEVEKRSQRQASTTQVFTGTFSHPTSGMSTTGTTRARGARGGCGTGSTTRGRGARGRGGRGRGDCGGRGGRGGAGSVAGSVAGSGGVPTSMPASAGEPPATAATIGAAPASFPTTAMNGSAPLRSLSNMDVTGGARVTPPAGVALLEMVQPPVPRKRGGSGKRKKPGSNSI
ncbi:unnamed protein product [Ectocarpus sp. CCAP 1310/34]|nr:unnamed protein product [Ectocarpus sp. CCAP 1310/34]